MNNLEKIKAAWSMGWSAMLHDTDRDEKIGHVVEVVTNKSGTRVLISMFDSLGTFTLGDGYLEYDIKITGYLYAGELAGNEIPEGQVFVKKNSKIMMPLINPARERQGEYNTLLELKNEDGGYDTYDKSQIEPYFE